MPRLPKFMRGGKIDYFGKKRITKDVGYFVEDLNFWLDRVYLYQREKTEREAERFIRQLHERIGEELTGIILDRIDGHNSKSARKKASKSTKVCTPANKR